MFSLSIVTYISSLKISIFSSQIIYLAGPLQFFLEVASFSLLLNPIKNGFQVGRHVFFKVNIGKKKAFISCSQVFKNIKPNCFQISFCALKYGTKANLFNLTIYSSSRLCP